MDCELRRRFLQLLSQDFAAIDLREMRVKRPWSGRADWPLEGNRRWPEVRKWWTAAA